MSSVVVRCPACRQLSRVVEAAVGLVVACPRCEHQFAATPDDVPTVRANRSRGYRDPTPRPPPRTGEGEFRTLSGSGRVASGASRARFLDDDPPVVHPHAAGGAPAALAMLPFGIPLLWLILSLVARPSVFTFAAPVAVAVGVCGLGLGLASVRRWSAAFRIRGLVVLVVLAYAASAVFYFTPPEWLEAVRVWVDRTGHNWREYRPDDKTFRVLVPGDPTPADSPLAGWPLTAVRVTDPKKPVDVFVVAHGTPPPEVPPRAADDEWFGRVKDALVRDVGAEPVKEEKTTVGEARARDYEFRVPGDLIAKRVVRVVRIGRQFYYLGVDGPSVTPDAVDVGKFWESFRLTPSRK